MGRYLGGGEEGSFFARHLLGEDPETTMCEAERFDVIYFDGVDAMSRFRRDHLL